MMPGYTAEWLVPGRLLLHLTDGRSWRGGDALLGDEQMAAMSAQLEAHPQAIHLVASGSTFGRSGRSGWQSAPQEAKWLLDWATRRRVFMISGDIHHTAWPGPIPALPNGQSRFWEATASGAAVNFNPFHNGSSDAWGTYTQKFGTLTLHDEGGLTVALFDHGHLKHSTPLTLRPDFSGLA